MYLQNRYLSEFITPILLDPQGKAISIGQLLDKNLVAKNRIPIYAYPDIKDSRGILKTIMPGYNVGSIYSWVEGRTRGAKDGSTWLMMYPNNDTNKNPFYIQYKPRDINFNVFDQQGVKTEEQIAKEKAEAEKSFLDKIQENALKGGKTILWIGGSALVIYLGIKLYKEYKK